MVETKVQGCESVPMLDMIHQLREKLITAVKSLENSTSRVKDLKEELGKRNNQLTAARKGLRRSNKLTASDDLEKTNLEWENGQLTAKTQQLEKENGQLTAKTQQLERKNSQLTAKSQQLEKENGQLTAKTQQLERKNGQLTAKFREIERKNGQLTAKFREIEKENGQLTAKIREIEKENDQLTDKIRDLEREKSQLESKIRELEREKDQLTAKSREMERENKEARTIISQLEKTLKRSESEVKERCGKTEAALTYTVSERLPAGSGMKLLIFYSSSFSPVVSNPAVHQKGFYPRANLPYIKCEVSAGLQPGLRSFQDVCEALRDLFTGGEIRMICQLRLKVDSKEMAEVTSLPGDEQAIEKERKQFCDGEGREFPWAVAGKPQELKRICAQYDAGVLICNRRRTVFTISHY